MIIGFLFRIICHYNTNHLMFFIMQSVFLVLPPAFFAATLYMSYTRVVRALGREDCSLISARWSTRIFLIADITCINVQGGGAGLLPSDTPATAEAGQYILVGGLVLHIVIFGLFLILCGTFHLRYKAWLRSGGLETYVPWRASLRMLYATSVIVMARNVFRAIEYVMGKEGYLMQNEWPIYVFDFGPMMLVMIAVFIWHPGNLVATEGERLELGSRAESYEPMTRGKTNAEP